MSTKIITGQLESESLSSTPPTNMGVASPSTKRRLEAPDGDEIVSAKMARKAHDLMEPYGTDNAGNENSSDFLTTSILARTLLTSSTTLSMNSSMCPTASYPMTSDPLESLKSSLEALPAPATFISLSKTTILQPDPADLEFSSLLCHERPLGLERTTVLSPIDDWNPRKATLNTNNGHVGGHQVITEDENGKSYFNLGSADATIVARKTIPGELTWANNYQNINNNNNNSSSSDFDDNASSSSCESISSEDLFNSGEEFDGSDDEEEELSSYKQQRSTVLHLSLCKLNKFRSQQCVEPSLHRSVLICNTLRHIEQEIKNEDEVDESLKSREKLPSFWRSTSNNHCFSNNSSSNHSSQPQITDSRPTSNNNNPLNNGHDPYLSPSPYSEPAYLSYDYNSLRPTPYHTTSYEYEHDLPVGSDSSSNSVVPLISEVASVASTTLLECDSGYGDDLDLRSYYYGNQGTPSQPPTTISLPTSPTDGNSAISSVNGTENSYLHHGFSTGMDIDLSVESGLLPNGVGPDGLSPPHDSESSMLVDPSKVQQNGLGKSDMGPEIKSNAPSSLVSTSLTVTCHSTSTSLSIPAPSACDYHLINGSSSSMSQQEDQMCWSTTTTSKTSTTMSMKEPSPSPTVSMSSSSSSVSFAQTDSQCGIESRRSELSHVNHFNNLNLPMDSLISSTYSSSL